MQECILVYFVCDIVSAMDSCAAQQLTWLPGMRDRPFAPPLMRTFDTSFIQ